MIVRPFAALSALFTVAACSGFSNTTEVRSNEGSAEALSSTCTGLNFGGSCRTKAWAASKFVTSGYNFVSAAVLESGNLVIEERLTKDPTKRTIHLVTPKAATSSQASFGGYAEIERANVSNFSDKGFNIVYSQATGKVFNTTGHSSMTARGTGSTGSPSSSGTSYFDCIDAAMEAYQKCSTGLLTELYADGVGMLMTAGVSGLAGELAHIVEVGHMGHSVGNHVELDDNGCLAQYDEAREACGDLTWSCPMKGDSCKIYGEYTWMSNSHTSGGIEVEVYDSSTEGAYCGRVVCDGTYNKDCECQASSTSHCTVEVAPNSYCE